MKPCLVCARHVRVDEPVCPFCGSALATVSARPWFALALLGAMTVGCGPSVTASSGSAEGDAGGTTDAADTGGGSQTASGPLSTTTTAGDVTGTTDGPPMTSSDVTGTSDGTNDTMGSSVGFIYGPPEDVPSQECGLADQDCPVGEKCMPWANDGGPVWNATRCSPIVDQPGAEGDPCTVEGSSVSGIDDCDLGLMCFFVNPDDNTGQCRSLCVGDAACQSPDEACAVIVDSFLELCLDVCDPALDPCPAGQACVPAGDGSVCAPEPG